MFSQSTYQLSIADRQWSKLSMERLSGLYFGTFGIRGCRIWSCSARDTKLLYLLYTVHAWKVSCWTHITKIEYGDAVWQRPNPATSTARDISNSQAVRRQLKKWPLILQELYRLPPYLGITDILWKRLQWHWKSHEESNRSIRSKSRIIIHFLP